MQGDSFRWEHIVGGLGVILFVVGSSVGLFVAPPDRFMGDVQRIMYVHVPSAWVALVCFSFAFIAAVMSLWTGRKRWDAILTGAIGEHALFRFSNEWKP